MSFACTVCGVNVIAYHYLLSRRFPSAWLCEYRAVYRDGSRGAVSGLGRFEGAVILSPPQDPSKRWDDENCRTVELETKQGLVPNGTFGYMIHESCWRILQKASDPTDLDISRLLDVFESLAHPESLSLAYWGHNYGGLWTFEPGKSYLWQEEVFKRLDPRELERRDILEDPFNVWDIPRLFTNQIQIPFRDPLRKESRDCFTKLPRELLDKIAALLITNDALNLRLASASFLPIFTSDHFWASRFMSNRGRGFVFEMKLQGYINWINLYRAFKTKANSGLRNRHRIWGLAKLIVDIVQRQLSHSDPSDSLTFVSSWSWLTSNVWSEAGQSKARGLGNACRCKGTYTATLPRDLSYASITTLDMNVGTYITGIRFVSRDGKETRLGYVAKHAELKFPITALRGFTAALARTGIRALEFAGRGAGCHPWAGDPTGMLISNGLVKSEPIQSLSIAYDAFKIVGIAIDKETLVESVETRGDMYLRNTAWYPHPPSEQYYLSSSSPYYPQFSKPGFHPLIYLDFGGPDGEYLPYVQRITIEYLHRLHSIEFHYAPNPFNLTSAKLGLGLGSSSRSQSPGKVFEVDGWSGERVTAVEVVAQRRDIDAGSPGALKGIRLTINDDRKLELAWSNAYDELQRLSLTKGTDITGFYAHQDETNGIYSLGLVSQASTLHTLNVEQLKV